VLARRLLSLGAFVVFTSTNLVFDGEQAHYATCATPHPTSEYGRQKAEAERALLALGARVVLASVEGEREVDLAEYFTGYRQTLRRPGELIRAVRIPLPLAPLTAFHKVAKRRFDDISSVAVAFALDVAGGVVRRARIGLGGVAATPIRAYTTEAALEGQPWTAETAHAAADVLHGEGTPLDDHRASADYRRAVLGTALLRLHAESIAGPVVEAPTGRGVGA
jgi:xanthine dehydrogenase small subunit